jgi:ketosteroid isomerase-like protein
MMLFRLFLAMVLAVPATAGPVEDSLMAADRAFDALAASVGLPEAFRAVSAPAVRMLRTPPTGTQPSQGAIVRGPENVMAFMAAQEQPGWTTRWAPTEAVASPDGLMGYTIGRWTRSGPGRDGKPKSVAGNYVTIWERRPGGPWQMSFDTGTPD